jgi:rare lipoprotein A
VRTSIGELYDMYGMTAAHKTLPLPAYVRVTNLQNGRSVVVRVNDRGPFVGNRIIDLSYSAAAKLDMLRNGTAMVEVRTVDPSAPPPVITASRTPAPAAAPPVAAAPSSVSAAGVSPVAAPPTGAAPASAAPSATAPGAATPAGTSVTSPAAVSPALFVQAGAFSDPANAERLAEKLRGGSYGKVLVREDQIAGRRMYRVRIGPVPDVAEFDRVVAALERAGINDAHLALD